MRADVFLELVALALPIESEEDCLRNPKIKFFQHARIVCDDDNSIGDLLSRLVYEY